MNHVTTAEKVLVELVGRDLYLLDEVDQRIIKLCRKHPAAKNNPAAVSKLFSYRVPIVNNLTRSWSALGLFTQGSRTEESRSYFQRNCR